MASRNNNVHVQGRAQQPPAPPEYQRLGQPVVLAGQAPLIPGNIDARPAEDPLEYLNPGPGPSKIPETVINLDFKDVFCEEKHTFTNKEIREVQNILNKYSRLVVYNGLSICFGFPLTIFWGIVHAIAMFFLIWLIYPTIKIFYVLLWPAVSGAYAIVISPWLVPHINTLGRLFRQFRFHVTMNNTGRRDERAI